MTNLQAAATELPPRERLIGAALRLFHQHGFHATGIERILTEAGVAKMTLYKHFGSKEELIMTALRESDARYHDEFAACVEARAQTPRARLLAVYDVLAEMFQDLHFFGCLYINAAAEFSDPGHPVHRACAQHKAQRLHYLHGLCTAAGVPEPEMLARQLLLLVEGAIVTAQVQGRPEAAHDARAAASALIEHALSRSAP